MEEVIARPFAFAAPVAGDAVAALAEAGKLLDVEMQELAWPLALIAANGRGRIQVLRRPSPRRLSQAATVDRASFSFTAISSAVSR